MPTFCLSQLELGCLLLWKEILLPHMIGTKDGSCENRLISAQQVPLGGSIVLWLSGFGNQMTLALNASLTAYIALQT